MKNSILIIAACIISFAVASCGGNSSSDKERIAQLEDSIARILSKQQAKTPSYGSDSENKTSNTFTATSSSEYDSNSASTNFLGTYKVIDATGHTFYIILNEDETANVKIEGSDVILYCSWEGLFLINKGIRIDFSDKRPIIYFDGGIKKYGGMYLKDGWLYAGSSEVESKHPQWRLKAEKVK